MWVAERVREFALLRIAGATRRQVLRMVRIEALSVVLLAAALALVATALPGRAALRVRTRPGGDGEGVATGPCSHSPACLATHRFPIRRGRLFRTLSVRSVKGSHVWCGSSFCCRHSRPSRLLSRSQACLSVFRPFHRPILRMS